ncbi:Xanthine and CO dehydrogenase maturation factor, XdhC/CoxF family [Lunatimonas lonarensis]|uniref:Xanthine and CO dehydrogenase maturation factor, XdhC/CoxF family n=1 Tax=Lunatimonas lonarensis TaxID=1232681 RepID=R7ZVI7_9BACT|nr:XdhC/CoxI family protein [Lunatimonas lonarensis]EON78156.1 Xanthine and CO dehydrogenase maturation factor, XdhC/CoxF family [Lunatimonas lonarensis]
MKEIKEIIKAFDQAQTVGEQTALATVVKVEGSSYRRPGARMLVTASGMLTGAISGGCLEGDALKKAQLVMFKKQAMVVTYDTTDDDDAKFGVGLGCNGIIHILIEPIDPEAENHPVNLLKKLTANRNDHVLVTFFDLENKREQQLGTCILDTGHGRITDGSSIPSIDGLAEDIRTVWADQQSLIVQYSAEQPLHAFIEWVPAHLSLVIVGAGNDAIPLARLAEVLGWEVCVLDGRATQATKSRFPRADQIHVVPAEEAHFHISRDKRTAVVLMTHNFNYDLRVMASLLPMEIAYLGVLGPKKKLQKMVENLANEGIEISDTDKHRIYGPAGLNIHAEAPEEIALSIVSEIKAVLSGGDGSFLKDKEGPIHQQDRHRVFGR